MLFGKALAVDFYLQRGVDWEQDVDFSDSSGPLNFSGCTGVCTIKDTAQSQLVRATPVVSFPSAGRIRLSLSKEKTYDLPVSGLTFDSTTTFVYDVAVVEADGFSNRAMNGSIEVSPEVTDL